MWLQSFKMLSCILIPAMAASFIPDPAYGSGVSNFFLQAFFQVQGDIKLQRVDSMMKGLEKMLQSYDPDFKFEGANTQELRDLFETAIVNASRANAESKLDRLRKILYGQIVDPQPYDYATRYLDLAVRLNDDQIRILKVFSETEDELKPVRAELRRLGKEMSDTQKVEPKFIAPDSKASVQQKRIFRDRKKNLEERIAKLNDEFNRISNIRSRFIKSINEPEFQFLFNDLRVLGLVYNPGEGRVSNTGEPAHFYCTALTEGFMKFLREPQKK